MSYLPWASSAIADTVSSSALAMAIWSLPGRRV